MSTKIYQSDDDHELSVTKFWGGTERGACYQISCFQWENMKNSPGNYVLLTRDETKQLLEVLKKELEND